MDISERIKNLRVNLKMTQTQLAKNAGLTSAAISQFEAGTRKPSFDALSKLANAFNVSTDFLLGKKEEDQKEIQIADEYIEMIRNIMNFSEENKQLMFEFYEFVKNRNSKRD
ncbi:TPA: XRE family transcriptional regulator [Candidatus Poribacteria bacterium]|nr:XRE family transcriptional regulator [Candidatus Poribacteria bacterium]